MSKSKIFNLSKTKIQYNFSFLQHLKKKTILDLHRIIPSSHNKKALRKPLPTASVLPKQDKIVQKRRDFAERNH